MVKLKIILATLFVLIGLAAFFIFTSEDPKVFAQELLQKADIEINGNDPWDITVHNEGLYGRVMRQGTLGLGEAYMDGWWDSDALDQSFYKIFKADLHNQMKFNWNLALSILKAQFINEQTKERSVTVGEQHYDLGNDLYELMLDEYMIYSCGYWKNATNLDEAQKAKLDLICRKLQLKPGMSVLDIGCGWGGFAKYAAEHYDVEVTGITISKEQAIYAQEFTAGLPVKIIVQDYRDLNQTFDRVVSIGMFEHVGYKNYREFMEIANKCLKNDGLFLLHTIGGNRTVKSGDPWILKYIFPNSMLPSICQIATAFDGLFIMEDWHNFGADYDKTLMAWYKRFTQNWDSLKDTYGEPFYRMWTYYLLSCAGLFRARQTQLWQVVLSKKGVPGGYKSVR